MRALKPLFLILAIACGGHAATHTDTWNQNTGSDQSIAVYGSYTLMEGTIVIPTSNVGRIQPTSGAYNTARRNDASPTANQYSQVVISAAQIASNIYSGPMVRGQTGAVNSYHVETNGSNYYLSKCLSGSTTSFPGMPVSESFAAGDVLRLEVTGTGGTVTLKVYRALAATPTTFVQLDIDYTDSSSPITTAGQYGVFAYGSGAGGGAWEGGDLGGGGGGAPAFRGTLLGVGH